MKDHPAYRRQNIEAQRKAGFDPQIGKWPGDPGYTGPIGETGDGRPVFADGRVGERDYGSKELNALAAEGRAVRRFIEAQLHDSDLTCRNPIGDTLSSHPEEAISIVSDDEERFYDESRVVTEVKPFDAAAFKDYPSSAKPGTTDAERDAAKVVFNAAFQFNQATKAASQAGLNVYLTIHEVAPGQPKVWTKVNKVTTFPEDESDA